MKLGFCLLLPRILIPHLLDIEEGHQSTSLKTFLALFQPRGSSGGFRVFTYSIFLATIIGPGLAFTQVEPITAGQTTGHVDRSADGPIIALPWDFWTWGSTCWVPSFRGVENAGPRETC